MKKSRLREEFEQKIAKTAKKKSMFCDFYVWRLRHPSKIAKRGFLNTRKRIINPACLQETVAFIFSACTRAEKLTPHLHFLRDLRDLLFKLFS
jgi:hypothetical protein